MSSFNTFHPPDIWNFRPFFTIQPNSETRDKQLNAWKDIIIDFSMQSRTYQLHLATFPYFRNDSIDRKLSSEAINAIIQHMIRLGNAEWEGDTDRSNVRVLWKSVQTLANEIYDWAGKQEGYGTVYTIYELCSSDEVADTPFHRTDPGMVRRALQQLESNHKCVIISGSTAEEDGVKFLSP